LLFKALAVRSCCILNGFRGRYRWST